MESPKILLIYYSVCLLLLFQGCKKNDDQNDSTDKNPYLLLKWRVTDVDKSGCPWGITIDDKGSAYVSERCGNTIDKFTSAGTFLTRWGSFGIASAQFNSPKYITVDGSNNIYVADNMNSRVQKFTSSGTYITQWGSPGSGNGQFSGTTGIAVDTNNNWVYVIDSNNSRIQKFDLVGNFIAKWGSYGTGNGQFIFYDINFVLQGQEGGVAVDKAGNVYVVDNMNCRIQKFTSSGAYITQWGTKGSGKGEFMYPSGIAIDNNANFVYISDNSTAYGGTENIVRIEKFDLSGNYVNQWIITDEQGNQSIGGLAVDNTGNVYAVEGESIYKYAF